MESLEKNLKRNNIAADHSQPCEVMNKTDLKERISLSEKFPLIKIMEGEGETEETTNKRAKRSTKKHIRNLTSKMYSGDFAHYNSYRLVMICSVGRLYGVVLMPVEFLASRLIRLYSLSRDLR